MTQGRERDVAHGERRAVGEHGEKHDRDHEKGAHGRARRPRDEEIGEGRERRRRRRPLLRRVAERERGERCEQRAQEREHRARHDRHVQARDRQDVEEAGIAKGVRRLRRDAAAIAGDERVGDGARLAGKCGADARADREAHALDRRGERERGRNRPRRLGQSWSRDREADGAEPLEPRPARKVIVARQRRARPAARGARAP